MKLGVTPNSILALNTPNGVNRVRTEEYKSFCELAVRQEQNRPSNEDRIRGIIDG